LGHPSFSSPAELTVNVPQRHVQLAAQGSAGCSSVLHKSAEGDGLPPAASLLAMQSRPTEHADSQQLTRPTSRQSLSASVGCGGTAASSADEAGDSGAETDSAANSFSFNLLRHADSAKPHED
jgi:hypothetical protein